jgi:RND family efflux transporter MFP subunit
VTRRGLLALLLAGCGAAASEPPARLVEARRQDLVIDVEVTGALKAVDADSLSPPAIPQFWDFKITRMAPEGMQVKAGQEVIAFDASELEKRLRDYESEVAALTEELGKAKAEAALAALNDRLESEQKEAEARKAELKADKPADIVAELKRQQAQTDRALAEREVEVQRAKSASNRRREQADLANLRDRLTRAQAYVKQSQEAIARMSVKAPRAGTVVYKQNWRGEKRKVGDQVYPGDSALEVALLDRMGADGQVDEVDASKVRKGQRVGLRLEANPDVEHEGTVADIATLVRTESPESRVKVARLELALSRTDPMMKPGMRFRGRIEVARVPQVLQIPIAALRLGSDGPRVARVVSGRTQVVPVRLGRRGREAVEVLEGLVEGDRVALQAAAGAKAGEAPTPGGGR